MNQRQEAINNYYKNPNICKFCGKIIEVTEGSKVKDIRRKSFCDRSCASKFYQLNNKHIKLKKCEICGKQFSNSRSKYCEECRSDYKFIKLQNKTKGELIKEKGYFRARSAICKNARTVYLKYNTDIKCNICGYDRYVEICHIKPVKDFGDEIKLSEINNIHNLIGLCPNHHKEFDNGLLKLNEINKRKINN